MADDITRNHEATANGFVHTPETVFAGSYYKRETTAYGTEEPTVGAGFKKFYGISVVPTIVQESKNIEVQGFTLPTGVLKGAESSTWSGSGSISYGDFGIIVDIDSSGPQYPKSYTLQHYDMKATGCAVTSYSISGSPLELNMDLGFVGKACAKGTAFPPSTAGEEAGDQVFFNPNATNIYVDNNLIQRVNAFNLSLDNIWNIANFINPEKQTIVQTLVNGTFSITEPLENNSGSGGYSVWKSDSVQTVKIENKTAIGTTDYWFTIEFNVMWNTPDAPGDNNNIWCIQNNATIIHKPTQPAVNVQSGIDYDVVRDH